jgi:excisionase family DNA binding protein
MTTPVDPAVIGAELNRIVARDIVAPWKPLTVTVNDASRMTGLGLTTIWMLIARGDLESTRVGTRRLVMYASLERLIREGRPAQQDAPKTAAATTARSARRK